MKKIVIFLSCFMVIPVFAEYINENTQLKWNSKVIEKALNDAGFINSDGANWDVRTTRNHILEDLLTRQMFSITEAIDVCKEQCNKSDFLKNGRGQSGKKCPELCESFANNIIKVNKEQYTSIPVVSATSGEFSNLQGKAIDVCRRLMSDATTNGISYPVLCGGRCDRFGQDKVQITDLIKTKEYEVDDFCNNDEKGRDYFYILSDVKGASDVSSLNESQRIERLKVIQNQPVSDYMKAQAEQIKKDKEAAYARRVEQNGYCEEEFLSDDETSQKWFEKNTKACMRPARKLAQANACKLKSYGVVYYFGNLSPINGEYYGWFACFANSIDYGYNNFSPIMGDFYDTAVIGGAFGFVENYEYVPSYSDCVATFNEKDCDKVSQGSYAKWY